MFQEWQCRIALKVIVMEEWSQIDWQLIFKNCIKNVEIVLLIKFPYIIVLYEVLLK